jgi:nucleotide-binding universal stress UspA family protein
MAENGNLIATRVIVSCDASPLGATAIDAAAALARVLDAELTGIFVEDINLIRMAALPFAQEVTLLAALTRRMQPDALRRLLEQQAHAVRDVLREAATALRLHWTFQVVRGPQFGSVLDAMRGLDLAVFGHAGRFSASAAASVRAPQQPVMVVFDGTPAAQRALDASAALAHDMHGRLVVAVIDTAGDATDLRAQAYQRLERQHKRSNPHTHALFLTLKRRDAVTVERATLTYAPAVLLWGGVTCDADRATLAHLVDALRCPVVLVA